MAHRSQECKQAIIKALEKEVFRSSSISPFTFILPSLQSELLLGSPMTYSLIQHVHDNVEELFVLAKTEDSLPQSVSSMFTPDLCTPLLPLTD